MVDRLLEYNLLEIGGDAHAPDAAHSLRVRDRYDTLAPYVTLVDHLLMMSVFRVRKRAIKALPLRKGDTVVELGCGTGRNFPHLRNAVGDKGRVIGVEFAPGMLARAAKFAGKKRFGSNSSTMTFPATRCRRPISCCCRCATTRWSFRRRR